MLKFFVAVAGIGILSYFALPVAAQDAPEAETAAAVFKGRPYSPNADRGFPTDVYFGDTHVHSALSADAGCGGTTLMHILINKYVEPMEYLIPVDSLSTISSDHLPVVAKVRISL